MNKSNICFVWIPKTAGTSVYTLMSEKLDMKLYIENYQSFNNEGNVTFAHLDVIQLIKNRTIKKEYFDNTLFFSVVRNPYDRFVSLFYDYKKSRRIAPHTTIREFAWAMKQFTRKPGLYNVLDHSQASSQISWLFPGIKILKYENLYEEMKREFSLEDIPHENKGIGSFWRDEFQNDDAKKLITELYYDDFTLLNYDIEI